MFRPDFGKSFFARHQQKLVAFANTWLGRKFFQLDAVNLPKTKIYEVGVGHCSYDWKLVLPKDGKMQVQKTSMFFTSPRFQRRLEYVYSRAASIVGAAAAWKLMQPAGALGFLPMLALTTTTVFPDANPESTSVDGRAQDSSSTVWATLRAAGGDAADDSSPDGAGSGVFTPGILGAAPDFYTIRRGIFLFDTSAVGTDTVSAGTFSLYVTEKADEMTTAGQIGLVSSAPASNTAVVAGDFDSLGTTRFADDIAISAISLAAYTDWPLIAAGISAVANGITKFGTRCKADIDNSAPTIGGSGNKQMGIVVQMADTALTITDPKLVVTHAAAATSYKNLPLMKVG